MRRYAPMKSSRGTTWPSEVRKAIEARDPECVGRLLAFPTICDRYPEIDHVRASGGIGMKSRSTVDNGVRLCGACHRWKTENGRKARPLLLEYLARVEDEAEGLFV